MGIRLHKFQSNFNGGEFSQRLEGRPDLEKYHSALKTLENFILYQQGGITLRSGTRYVSPTKTAGRKVRLVAFSPTATANYILEFGHLYIRFYTNQSRLLAEVTTSYTEADLPDLNFAQSIDVLYIVHPSYPPSKLTRITPDGLTWDFRVATFVPPPTTEKGLPGTVALGISDVSGEVIIKSDAAYFLVADVGRIVKYLIGRGAITVVTSGTEGTLQIYDAFPAEKGPVAGTGTLSTDGPGTGITLTDDSAAVVGNYFKITSGPDAGKISRITVRTDPKTFTVADAFTGGQAGITFAVIEEIKVTDSWMLLGSPVAKITPTIFGPVGAVVTLNLDVGKTGFRSADVGTPGAPRYLKMPTGLVKLKTYVTNVQVTGEIINTLGESTSSPGTALAAEGGAWTIEDEAWNATDGYPGTVGFFEQRMVLGGTRAKPQTFWGSRIDDFENFGLGALFEDAFSYTIAASQFSPIQYIVPSRVLLIGTLSGEYRAGGGADGPLTPSSVMIRSESSMGSENLTPLKVANYIIFLQRNGRKLRELAYSFEQDAYKSEDLTKYNPEVTEGGVLEMAYQQDPDSIVWAVRGDGKLLGLTYNRIENVFGWHRHGTTGGLFESVAVIPAPDGSHDQVWVAVNRGGNRYVEYFDPVDGANAVYVDHYGGPEGSKEYTGTAVTLRPELDAQASLSGRFLRWSKAFARVFLTRALSINGEVVDKEYEYTGDVSVRDLGYDKEGRITITASGRRTTILSVYGMINAGEE